MTIYRAFAKKPEGKRSFGRPTSGLEDNTDIKSYRNRMGESGQNSPGTRQVQVVGTCKHENGQSASAKCGESLD